MGQTPIWGLDPKATYSDADVTDCSTSLVDCPLLRLLILVSIDRVQQHPNGHLMILMSVMIDDIVNYFNPLSLSGENHEFISARKFRGAQP